MCWAAELSVVSLGVRMSSTEMGIRLWIEIIKVGAGLEQPGQHKVDERKLEKIENQN